MSDKKWSIIEDCPKAIGYRLYKGGNIEVVRSTRNLDIDRGEGKRFDTKGDKDTSYCGEGYFPNDIKYDTEKPKRGAIQEFSLKSRLRMAWTLSITPIEFRYMSTLTYGRLYPKEPSTVMAHRNRVLNTIRRFYDKEHGTEWKRLSNVGYFWFLEFQKRGASHLHILLSDRVDTDRLLKVWVKINKEMGNNLQQVRWVHSRLDSEGNSFLMQPEYKEGGLRRYGIKYGLKMEQKTPPKWFNGRFYGYSRNVANEDCLGVYECTEEQLVYMLNGHRVTEFDILPRYILSAFDED